MVYIPLLSTRSLGRRLAGGGGAGVSSSSGSKGGSSSSSGSSSGGTKSGSGSTGSRPGGSSSSPSTSRQPISVPGTSAKSSSAYGPGGGPVRTIPSGAPFAGRQQGGGTRAQVYGSKVYGSGYPFGGVGRGVAGGGFPFYFWPLAWGAGLGYGAGYLHDHEYGEPDNSTRPGGVLNQVTVQSHAPVATYHVVADASTVGALIDALAANCTSIANRPLVASAFNASRGEPQPETVIQYYRASSVALTLDGYNNTAALSDDDKLPPTPLPTGLDQAFLQCLNATIGAGVPLVDDSSLAVAGTPSDAPEGVSGSIAVASNPWLLLFGLTLALRRVF